MRKAACNIYFRLRVLTNIVFYGIKISSSHHEPESHDIIRVLSFMLLIFVKVSVDRNEVISNVFYFCLFSVMFFYNDYMFVFISIQLSSCHV